VYAPILPIIPESVADEEVPVRRHRDVTAIEQLVYVRSQQESVLRLVVPTTRNWNDVRGLKHWISALSGNGAPFLIRVSH
jgi:hypothetical protein